MTLPRSAYNLSVIKQQLSENRTHVECNLFHSPVLLSLPLYICLTVEEHLKILIVGRRQLYPVTVGHVFIHIGPETSYSVNWSAKQTVGQRSVIFMVINSTPCPLRNAALHKVKHSCVHSVISDSTCLIRLNSWVHYIHTSYRCKGWKGLHLTQIVLQEVIW